VSLNPEVSVIIPAYNRAELLERAVDSVLSQREVGFELLLVDDASERPAEALYRRVEEGGHQVLRLERNCGPGAARNAGAALARGEWLAFLDSDDYWLPAKLARHLESLRASGLSIGQAEEIWYRNGRRVTPPKPHRIQGGDLFARSLKAVCVSCSTVMLTRELFQAFGGFDEELFVCEDYDLWLRVSAKERFEFCPEPLVVKHGGHPDQLSKVFPAMDRFRILSLLKGLVDGAFKGREEAVLSELFRKLNILSKGAAKRGKEETVQLCERIAELVSSGHLQQACFDAGKFQESRRHAEIDP